LIPGRKYTPEVLLALVWRRKWLVVLPTVFIGCGVAVWVHRLPNVYQSDVAIQVEPPRITQGFVRPTERVGERLQTIYQQVTSRPSLEQIIQELYPGNRTTEMMDRLIAQMRKSIVLKVVSRDTIRVSYTGDDASKVLQVAERLASMFIDQSLREREVLTEGTSEFVESQLEDARRRLIATEAKLGEFIRRYGGELPAQLEANSQGLRAAEQRIQALNDSINRDRDRKLFVERQIADAAVEDVTPSSPASRDEGQKLGPTAARLWAAQEELRAMELRLKPEHPNVVRMKRTVVELQERAAAEAAGLASAADSLPANPAEALRRNRQKEQTAEIEKLERDIDSKLNDQELLRQAVAEFQRRIDATPKREAEMKELTRDYDTLQTLYKGLLSKKEDSRIATNVERRQIGEQFKIIEPPVLPQTPVSPDRLRLNLAGLVGGLLCGLGLVALLVYLDRSLASDTDVTATLHVPVLATIPLLGSARAARRRQEIAVSAAGFAALVFAAAVAWRLLK
jgi:polysaccharide chain length determinant protein (PEP-CTERM system associated)